MTSYSSAEDFIKEKQEQLGKRFREIRIAKGYTNYEQFAFEHRIPRAQYGRYEKGSDLRFNEVNEFSFSFRNKKSKSISEYPFL